MQLADQQRTVRDLADDTATLRKHIEYDSFGAPGAVSSYGSGGPSVADQLFYFTGQEYDASTGFYNYDARWYDPYTGRFLSEDPSGLGQDNDPNLYRYAGNSPTNFTDPTGLYQAGNPLDNLFGGYRAGPVQPAPKISPSLAAGSNALLNLVNSGFQFTTPSRSTYIPIDAVFNGLVSAPYTSAPPIANAQVWKPVDIHAVRSVVRDAYVSAAQRPSPAPEPGIIRSGFDYVSNTAAAGYVRGLKNSVDRTAESAFRGAVYAWNDPGGAIANFGSGLQETKDTITDYTVGWFFESQRAKNSATIRGASDAAIARFDQLKDASTYEQARAIGDIVGTGAQLWSPTTRLTSRIRPLAIIDDVAPSSNRLNVLEPKFVPTGRAIVSVEGQAQANRGAANLVELMTERQQRAYLNNPASGSRFLGSVVHRETAQALRAYGDRFIYNRVGPDFFDNLTGQSIELTTPGQVGRHISKGGAYTNAEYSTYVLPLFKP